MHRLRLPLRHPWDARSPPHTHTRARASHPEAHSAAEGRFPRLPRTRASEPQLCRYTLCRYTLCRRYVFVGTEEVGMQVEQPFEIVPMTQIVRRHDAPAPRVSAHWACACQGMPLIALIASAQG